jgi:DNA-binding PadR family transcriptional regulator
MPSETVKCSILQLVSESPKRYSEILRELSRPDKTIYVSLKQLLAAGHVRKVPKTGYVITEKGKAALVEEELETTAVELVEKLGPEKARAVKRCLEELLAERAMGDFAKRSDRKREALRQLAAGFD